MSDEGQSLRTIDERLFDRLVDNELDAAGRRHLLMALDESADGWRRCALAFLEAQAWRSDLRGAMNESAPPESSAARAIVRPRSRALRIGQVGMVACVAIVAFGAGWLIRPGGDGRRGVDPGTASSSVVQRDRGEVEQPDGSSANSGPSANTGSSANSGATGPEGPDGKPDVRMAGTLTLEIEDHGQPRTLQVPVIEGRAIDVRWLLDQPPAVRASVVRALERRGHRVEAHRQLVTVNLKDGRRLILPVDEVDVRFAGRVFQ